MDRYTNKHILETPDLKPERHYESLADFNRNIEDTPRNDSVNKPPHPLLPVLQRLMDLEGMADLAPSPERDIVKAVTKSMIKLTKGIVIDTLIHYPGFSEEKKEEKKEEKTSTYTYEDVPSVLDYEIKMEEPESLYSIAYAAYINDYNDIAKEYASSMEQVLNRFFQTMVSLSDDCNMPVYTYLLRDFDGVAVKVDDEDLLPAKDLIIKNQAIRNRDLAMMQKIYTEENTLLYGRAWAIGEKERERYLKADYKTNTSSLCTTLGNQMLTDSRNESYKKYRAGMSSMYKYLNSSVINTAQALDKRTYEATAKGQLALNGVDIFKQSPIPKPYDYSKTADDNKQVTQGTTDSIGSSIDEGINNVMPETVPAGGAGGNGVDTPTGAGTVDRKTVFNALKAQGYSPIEACGVMGNIDAECTFDSTLNKEDWESKRHSYIGFFQLQINAEDDDRGANFEAWCNSNKKNMWDGGVQIEYMVIEAKEKIPEVVPGALCKNPGGDSPSGCAYAFAYYYERCFEGNDYSWGVQMQGEPRRRNSAEAYYQEYQSGAYN